ncbi:MAG: IPT/TIG domain-containing protein [Holophaga sp.]|nr:IPT/TIG domain-containing protein [Holophaga sp.]
MSAVQGSRRQESCLTWRNPAGALAALLFAVLAAGCGGSSGRALDAGSGSLAVTAFAPAEGGPGTPIHLTGSGLSSVSAVSIAGHPVALNVVSDTQATFWLEKMVPPGSTSFDFLGADGTAVASSGPFEVLLPTPAIELVGPLSARPGQEVYISGSGFGDDFPGPSVTLGGERATVLGSSNQEILFQVPQAPSLPTGPCNLVVTRSDGGASDPVVFDVLAAQPNPTVGGVYPEAGRVGAKIAIHFQNMGGVDEVRFGDVRVLDGDFQVQGPGLVLATVPSGAVDGTIYLSQGQTSCASQLPFKVLPTPAAPAPVIQALGATSGASTSGIFQITGSNLDTVSQATLNGVPVPGTAAADGSAYYWWLPQNASARSLASGQLTLKSPFGTATSTETFSVLPHRAIVSRIVPRRGPVGTLVKFYGRHMEDVFHLAFGTVPLFGDKLGRDSEYLSIEVPEATFPPNSPVNASFNYANAGLTDDRVIQGPDSLFTVAKPNYLSDGIVSVVLSQGVQDLAGITQGDSDPSGIGPTVRDTPTPLLAGRDGLLRVYLQANHPDTDEPGNQPALRPTVRVTLQLPVEGGVNQLIQNIPCPGTGIPEDPQDGVLGDTWNLHVSGEWIQPGVTLLAEILPGPGQGSFPDEAFAKLKWPWNGVPRPLTVVSAPPLRITLIPVQVYAPDGSTQVTGSIGNLQDWAAQLRKLLPVADLDLVPGPTLFTNITLTAEGGYADLQKLTTLLERRRLQTREDATRFYVGVFPLPQGSTALGWDVYGAPGSFINRSMVVMDRAGVSDSEAYDNGGPAYLIHQLGHALGLKNAPYGGTRDPDLNYPDPPAGLGTWGVDVAAYGTDAPVMKNPEIYQDVMSYTDQGWISRYTYRNFLNALDADAAASEPPPSAGPGILVSGILENGALVFPRDAVLNVSDSQPAPTPGSCHALVLDAQGQVLQDVPFAPQAPTEGSGPLAQQSFLFEVPLTAEQLAAVHSVQIVTGVAEQ